MRISLLASVAAIALVTIPGSLQQSLPSVVPAAQAQGAELSVSVFYDGLRDHGRWVSHPRHRYVWVPVDVDPDWRPYSHGRWVYTDRYGWYFASDEPFAWAVYHYGRWAFDDDIGWFWVPGRVWGPAWVTWRRGGDHLGWAPLPPEGDAVVVDIQISNREPPRGYWVFVPATDFLAPDLTVVILEREEIPVIYERTEFVGPVVIENNVVVNTTIDVDFIEQTTRKEVEVTEVQVVQDPAAARDAGDALVAVEGELAVEEGAKPAEVVEVEQVEAPTSRQEVEASTQAEQGDDGEAEDAEQPAGQAGQPAEASPSDSDGEAEAGQSGTGSQAGEKEEAEPADSEEEAGQSGTGSGPEAKQDRVPSEPSGQDAGTESQDTEAPAAEEQPREQKPAEAGEQPAESGQPAQQQQEQPAEDRPAEEQPAQEQPEQDQPGEDRPAGEQQPAQGQQGEERPSQGEQREAQPDGGQGEAPSADCSAEDRAAGRCQ